LSEAYGVCLECGNDCTGRRADHGLMPDHHVWVYVSDCCGAEMLDVEVVSPERERELEMEGRW
jgi:hypothetical protein